MLRMFAMVFKCFQVSFSSVLSVFFYMLQVFALNVSKVDRASAADLHVVVVDHIFRRCFSTPQRLVAAGRPRPCSSGQRRFEAALVRVSPSSLGPAWVRGAGCRRGRPAASSADLLLTPFFFLQCIRFLESRTFPNPVMRYGVSNR
jgi:hypothetical protein